MGAHESSNIRSRLTPTDDAYETCEKTRVVLRIYSGKLHPSQVTALLGLDPSRFVAAGGSRVNSLGRAPASKPNGWFLSSEEHVESKDTRRHLDWLIAKLRPSADALHDLQGKPDVRMSVNCTWWSRYGDGGPTLWPEQMRALADLNLECSFDFADYSDDTAEIDDIGSPHG